MVSSTANKVWNGIKGLFKGGFFHILTGNVTTKAIAMVSSIVIARLVDKVDYAHLSYADNIYSYITLLSGLGMSSALLKFCSANNQKAEDAAYVRFAYKVGGAFEFFAAFLACVALSFFDIPYKAARIYAWFLILNPVLSYFNTTNAIYMRTQLENKKYAMVGVAGSAFSCIFAVLGVVAIGVKGIIAARYLSVFLVLAYSFSFIYKRLKDTPPIRLSGEQKKAFVTMGFSLAFANFFSGIMPINETFLVNNIIRDANTSANFRVAGLLPQMLLLISGAVTVYYFPIVARMTDAQEIRKKVLSIAVVNFSVIAIVTLIGMVSTPLVIRILYGEKYLDAVSLSYVLWLMRAANAAFRSVPMNMIVAIGKVRFNLGISIVSCVTQCLLDYVFLRIFGIYGVAYGASLVYVLSAIAYWVYFLYCCRNKVK